MKTLFFVLLFNILLNGLCPIQAQEGDPERNPTETDMVCLYQGEGVQEHINLFNLMTNALAYGLVNNGIRNGSGNNDRVALSHGKTNPPTEGPYSQATRLLSLIDWDLGRGLYNDKNQRPLPPQILAMVGPMTKEDQEKLQEKSMMEWPLKLPFAPLPRSLQSTSKEEWKGAIFRGLASKMTEGPQGPKSLLEELPSIAASLDWTIPEEGKDSRLEMEFLLPIPPAFKKWPRMPIPGGDVVTVFATLTEMSFLNEGPQENIYPVVKAQVLKDFSPRGRRKLRLNLTFGRLNEEKNGLDHTHPEDALIFYGKAFLPPKEGDSRVTRRLKKWFNAKMDPYDLETRFHQIGLEFSRKGEKTLQEEAKKDHPMRPSHLVHQDTHVSYKVWRRDVSPTQMKRLRRMGFTCIKAEKHCYQEFASWQDFETNFLGGYFKGFVTKAVGKMTNLDFVLSLPDLEKEADKDLAAPLEKLKKNILELRKVLVDSLVPLQK